MTDHPENYGEGRDLTDSQRWTVAELMTLDQVLDRQQDGLEQLAAEDPVGLVWFGEKDAWVDARLSRRNSK